MFDDNVLQALWGFLGNMYSWATSHYAVDCTIGGTHYTLTWWNAEISLFLVLIIAEIVTAFMRHRGGGADD